MPSRILSEIWAARAEDFIARPRGEIAIDGTVVNDVDAADRDIAMVFQSYALYPHMTIRQNLVFGLTVRRASARSIAQQLKAVSGVLGLDDLLDRYPRQLSGGQ